MHKAKALAIRCGNYAAAEELAWPAIVSRDGRRALQWERPGPPSTQEQVESLASLVGPVEALPLPGDCVEEREPRDVFVITVLTRPGHYCGHATLVYWGKAVKGTGKEPGPVPCPQTVEAELGLRLRSLDAAERHCREHLQG